MNGIGQAKNCCARTINRAEERSFQNKLTDQCFMLHFSLSIVSHTVFSNKYCPSQLTELASNKNTKPASSMCGTLRCDWFSTCKQLYPAAKTKSCRPLKRQRALPNFLLRAEEYKSRLQNSKHMPLPLFVLPTLHSSVHCKQKAMRHKNKGSNKV